MTPRLVFLLVRTGIRGRSAVTQLFAQRATLQRSVGLLRDFGHEQTAPDVFYGALARDSVELVGDLYRGLTGETLHERVVLDVGGGPGYFAEVFHAHGAQYFPVEHDASEMHAAGLTVHGSVRGSGMALPFRTSSVDICFSSNVAEHVRDPWLMAEEMLRVTKPGGMTVLSYTLWLSPFGGHETRPWHYLGGEPAATPVPTGKNRRTDSANPCSTSAPPTDFDGREQPRTEPSSPHSRATTRAGLGGSSAYPDCASYSPATSCSSSGRTDAVSTLER